MRRAARAACLGAQVNSTLGLGVGAAQVPSPRVPNPSQCTVPTLTPAPEASKSRHSAGPDRAPLPVLSTQVGMVRALARRQQTAQVRSAQWSVVVGASRRRAAPRSQPHGRAALQATGPLRRRRAGGAERKRPCAASSVTSSKPDLAVPQQLHQARVCHRPSPRPNMSFNRSSTGMAPGPCGAVCTSSAARARRHAVVARLTLR